MHEGREIMIDLTFLAPWIQVITVIVLSINVWLTLGRNREVKSMDVAIECQNRFMDTVYDARSLVEDGKMGDHSYYLRFWNLQIDQYQYWALGYVKTDIYRYWMRCRFREWSHNKTLDRMDYRQGWEFAIEQLSPPLGFIEFMTKVFNGSIENALDGKKEARSRMYARAE